MTLVRWHRPETSRWTPFQQWSSLRDEFDRMFATPFAGSSATQPFFGGWSPAIDLWEGNESLTFKAELPGMKKEDIEISLHEGVLSIAGERKLDPAYENAETHRTERFFGRFQRSVTLPVAVNADQVKASYSDGILTIVLPKAEEAKPKHIQVHLG